MYDQAKSIIEQIKLLPLAGKLIIGAAGSVLGACAMRAWGRFKKRHVREFQKMEAQASFADEDKYLFALDREIERTRLVYTDNPANASVYLTCFVDPFWFKDKDVKARIGILDKYDNVYQQCQQKLEIIRLVILSKSNARKFKRRHDASKSKDEDIIG